MTGTSAGTGGIQPPGGLGKGKSVWKESEDKGVASGVRGISLFMRKSRSSDDSKRNILVSPDKPTQPVLTESDVEGSDACGPKDARKADPFQPRSRLGSFASAFGSAKFVRARDKKKDIAILKFVIGFIILFDSTHFK